MIQITVKRNSRRVSVDVTGHAGAGRDGNDVVCASVSVLILTLAEALGKAKADVYQCDLAKGEAHIVFGYNKRNKTIWETIEAGLRLLSRSFPLFIAMTEQSSFI